LLPIHSEKQLSSVAEIEQRRSETLPGYDVLGVRVTALGMDGTIATIERWIGEGSGTRFVAVINVHMVMMAREDQEFSTIVASTDMAVPDGMPLIWAARRQGIDQQRVYGPDLLVQFLRNTERRGYRHFFYGGRPEMLEAMVARIRAEFPNTQIAGAYAPPFRPLTPEEDAEVVQMIREADADVIWVGIGCPKQERWISEHRAAFDHGVMLGVGQAFDQYAGIAKRAPAWMQGAGLEWLYRLCTEPRRLWRRYLVYNSRFLAASLRQGLGRDRKF
jgi:N-acetylglucosaminyldiphosphoundecaprenol N-acetyl-beta-D-mannosaminyltransferase